MNVLFKNILIEIFGSIQFSKKSSESMSSMISYISK